MFRLLEKLVFAAMMAYMGFWVLVLLAFLTVAGVGILAVILAA